MSGTSLRVAMVSEHASPLAVLGGVDAGGQNVHVAELGRAMAGLGAEVTIFTRRDAPHLPREVRMAPGVRVMHVDAGPPTPVPKDELLPHMPAFAAELRHDWSDDRPDVVHAHYWMSGMAAMEAARALDVPMVQTFHALGVVKQRQQGWRDTSPPQRACVERALVEGVDLVVATCSDEMFELLRLGGESRRISVVPCGVDLDVFTPTGPSERRRPRRRRAVVVSRLVERKGIGNVITALRALPPDVELVVAGGPAPAHLGRDPEARRLLALAEQEGVADRVCLRGRVDHDELPALLRSADVVVCVPWYEPFGIVPLEAMACGVPVVASAVGGQVDTVVDGVTGLHVPPRSPAHVTAAMRRLLDDAALRAAMGGAGRTRARARYGWARVAAATLAAYNGLARQRHGTSSGLSAR